MRKTILLILIGFTLTALGQKKPLIDNFDKVVAQAKLEIEQSMKGPEGGLYLFTQEYEITGTYDFDITLHEKGKVATVYVKGSEGGTIKKQNMLKDFVKDMQFNFKMPKGKDYKFNYVFKF